MLIKMLNQIDIPNELNHKLKLYKSALGAKTISSVIIKILEEKFKGLSMEEILKLKDGTKI